MVFVNAMMPALSALPRGDEVETVECHRFDFDRSRGLMWERPPRFPYSGATIKIVGPARWQLRRTRPTLLLQRRAGRDGSPALSFDPLGRASGALLGALRHRSSRSGSVPRG
jgi:hypothetical protein